MQMVSFVLIAKLCLLLEADFLCRLRSCQFLFIYSFIEWGYNHVTVSRENCEKLLLRTFARKFSNIDFFLKILPLKDDELVM